MTTILSIANMLIPNISYLNSEQFGQNEFPYYDKDFNKCLTISGHSIKVYDPDLQVLLSQQKDKVNAEQTNDSEHSSGYGKTKTFSLFATSGIEEQQEYVFSFLDFESRSSLARTSRLMRVAFTQYSIINTASDFQRICSKTTQILESIVTPAIHLSVREKKLVLAAMRKTLCTWIAHINKYTKMSVQSGFITEQQRAKQIAETNNQSLDYINQCKILYRRLTPSTPHFDLERAIRLIQGQALILVGLERGIRVIELENTLTQGQALILAITLLGARANNLYRG